MSDVLAHRGPDDRGAAIVQCGQRWIGFGHRRLSIIDTSTAGRQPMIHPETGDVLVYNGEIYNSRRLRDQLTPKGVSFIGRSDTEVLLHALVEWGAAVVDRLEGMYAFAFLLRQTNQLFLARDPLGIKPLYVQRTEDQLVFASEQKALLAAGWGKSALDKRSLASFLAFGSVPAPFSTTEGVEEFPAGAVWRVELDGLRFTAKQWHVPRVNHWDPKELPEKVHKTLSCAVADHLVSDVPLAVFLSSGIDSGVIAALAHRHKPDVEAFTVGFEDDHALSECEEARVTARELGVRHREVWIQKRDALDNVSNWISSLDSPSVDGLNVFLISKAVRSAGIKVALSGQGADELFAGYPSFRDVPRILRALRRAPPLWRLRNLASLRPAGMFPCRLNKLLDFAVARPTLIEVYLRRRRVFDDAWLRKLVPNLERLGLAESYVPEEALSPIAVDEDNPAWMVSQLETRFYLGNMLLRDADNVSMTHGLEVRVPYLDRRLMELMFTVPDGLRLGPVRRKKPLLDALAKDLLSPAARSRKKRGFQLPYAQWMRGPLRATCTSNVGALVETGLLRPEAVARVWERFLAGSSKHSWVQAWALVVLGGYLRERSRQHLAD